LSAPSARPTPLSKEEGRSDPDAGQDGGRETEAEEHCSKRSSRSRINGRGPQKHVTPVSTGVVDEVNLDKNTLKVMVTIFGPLHGRRMDFLQVEKI
jgi:transcriptional antiterminator NusG